MHLINVYIRALGLLAKERGLTFSLVLANAVIGLVQLAEPILLGRVVDALSTPGVALPVIGLWAALGLFGIMANVVVAIAADRLAHRQRLVAQGHALRRGLSLPLRQLAGRRPGAL